MVLFVIGMLDGLGFGEREREREKEHMLCMHVFFQIERGLESDINVIKLHIFLKIVTI